ncbi:MAG: hypothetical protein MZU97_07855 [Bacillus subtilis]|nr:hypothetical protein [Bacillus subtilis]
MKEVDKLVGGGSALGGEGGKMDRTLERIGELGLVPVIKIDDAKDAVPWQGPVGRRASRRGSYVPHLRGGDSIRRITRSYRKCWSGPERSSRSIR